MPDEAPAVTTPTQPTPGAPVQAGAPATPPAAPETPPVDRFESVPENLRDVVRSEVELIEELAKRDPVAAANVIRLARERDAQLRGNTPPANTPATPPKPETPPAEETQEQKLARLERDLAEQKTWRENFTATEQRKEANRRFETDLELALAQHDVLVSDPKLRQLVKNAAKVQFAEAAGGVTIQYAIKQQVEALGDLVTDRRKKNADAAAEAARTRGEGGGGAAPPKTTTEFTPGDISSGKLKERIRAELGLK